MSKNSNQAIWDTAIYNFPYPLEMLQEKAGSLNTVSDKFALAYMENYSMRQSVTDPIQESKVTIYSYWQEGQLYIDAEILPSLEQYKDCFYSQSKGYIGKYNPRSQDWQFAISN